MADLERRLQFAMVTYAAGAHHDITPGFVFGALGAIVGIEREWISVHSYRPEDFLIIFGRQEHRNRVAKRPFVEHRGVRLYFRQWNRQAQAVHAVFEFKVSLVLEGIPAHAWERGIAEDLLGSSCLVDMVAPETSSRQDLSAFRITTWTAEPVAIPLLRWLAVPELGQAAPLMEPSLLQYKILIHLDSVSDFSNRDEPLFLGVLYDSGQSGVPSDGRISGDGWSRSGPRRVHWQFGVRDVRGQRAGQGAGDSMAISGPGGGSCLPAMEERTAAAPRGGHGSSLGKLL
uniref:DUF4283 domain-containing protein n=1 Tax=Aegilops tauschii subsp. strangulata TaxID=200361 RepID=A0A453HV93_AEGTS